MSKKIGILGGMSGAARAAALLAAAASLGGSVAADVVKTITKKLKVRKPQGTNPTPEAIARRKARKLKRLVAKANGGFVYHPAVQSRPSTPASTRGERRREKLGRS